MGAYVKLLEYDNIDGMILLSELSRRRIRSIQKLIRIGRNEVVVVLRVDKEKGMRKTSVLRCTINVQCILIWVPSVRLYRSFQTTSVSRRCCQVRGTLQQEQVGAFDHAPRRRKDQDPDRRIIPEHRLAAKSQFRPCLRCVQAFDHVRTTALL